MRRIFIVFFLFLCFSTRFAIAQEDLPGLQLKLTAATAEPAQNGITELMVQLSNTGDQPFEGSLEIIPEAPYRLLTKTTSEVQLDKGGERYLPVKLYTSGHALGDSSYRIRAVLKRKDGHVLLTDEQVLAVKKVVNVTMFLLNDQLLIRDEKELVVPVHLVNNGNTQQTLTIIVKYPAGYRHRDYSFARIVLAPFTDTVLQYHTELNGELYRKGDFDLRFTGLYNDGNLIGTATARIAVARSVRRFHTPQTNLPTYDGTPNSITLMARYIGDPLENYELLGGSSVTLGNSRITYQVDATVWKSARIDPVVRNTYIGYEYKNAGVIVGNINRPLDINLFGKGAAAYLKPARGQRIEAGYIVDGYNLIEREQPFTAQKGWSAWVHHEYTGKKVSVKTDLINNNPSFVRVSNQVVTSEIGLLDKKNNRLQLNAGIGRTADIDNSGNQEIGYSGGLIYSYQLKKFRFNTNNYASSGYYPGFRRGAVILSERIDFQYHRKYRLWTGYTYYSFRPLQLSGTANLPISRYRSGKAELGWDVNPGKQFSYSVSANYQEEGSSFNASIPGDELTTIHSAHLAATLNVSNPFSRYFASLTVEGGGYYTSVNTDDMHAHFKANLTASYQWLRLAAYYQQGYFQANEVLSYYNLPGDNTYHQLTINPQVSKTFLKDRLKIDAGFAYNTNSRSIGATLVTCGVQYSLTSRLTAMATYNRFGYGNTSQNIYEAGFTYALPPASSDIFRGGKTLQVFVFRDKNGNGVFDPGEAPASRQAISLNNTPFLTDAGGFARYKRLPDTTVYIQVADDKDWYATDRTVTPGTEIVRIALQRTATVSGQLAYLAGEYSYDIEQRRAGIVVSLSGPDKTYKVRTDEQGRFIFYVPAGTYEFLLDTGNLSDKIECLQQGQAVAATVGTPFNLPVQLRIKGRKVNLKKFGTVPSSR